jgi:type VI protein secretion system component VasF
VRPKPTHHTRSARKRRRFWKNFFIWAFLFVFAFSVVGGLIVVSSSLAAH